jgi:hypothetical protein
MVAERVTGSAGTGITPTLEGGGQGVGESNDKSKPSGKRGTRGGDKVRLKSKRGGRMSKRGRGNDNGDELF